MSAVITPPPMQQATQDRTIADLLRSLGDISPARVLLSPPPGTATVADLVHADDHRNTRCELVDGVLVEKGMGFKESQLAAYLIMILGNFVRARDLGVITGEAGMMQILPNLVRMPDVAFTSWNRFPGGRVPSDAAPSAAPDLAIEILCASNTRREMDRKRREYFKSGTRLVWIIYPDPRTIDVYTSPDHPDVTLTVTDTLDGGDALPGFSHPIAEIFKQLDRFEKAGV